MTRGQAYKVQKCLLGSLARPRLCLCPLIVAANGRQESKLRASFRTPRYEHSCEQPCLNHPFPFFPI